MGAFKGRRHAGRELRYEYIEGTLYRGGQKLLGQIELRKGHFESQGK
jgi:hypothetical protein